MGYRSDVIVKFSTEAGRAISAACRMDDDLVEMINDADSLLTDAEEITRAVVNKNTKIIRVIWWESVKWYEHYDEQIIKFMDLIKQLPDQEYGFMRLGEDRDDVEEYGQPWEYDIYIRSSLEW